MSCNNCFNGCAETTSDKCVKYTGVDIPALGIQNGDTLISVEGNITTYLLTALDGTGIVPYINPASLCALVTSYLPGSGTITLINVIDALIKSICDLQGQVTGNTNAITVLNADYTIGCLTGVVASDNTHEILQATINKVCSVSSALTALALDVVTNYVAIADIDAYIQAYLDSIAPITGTDMKDKMVPYTVVEYYGSLTVFDGTGAGTGVWDRVFLCNGQNSTPDKRGRVGVGVTDGTMLGATMNATVNPSTAGNPSYSLNTPMGSNTVTLTSITQIPSHTHTGTIIAGGAHTHNTQYGNNGTGTLYAESPYISDVLGGTAGLTTSNGEHTHTMTNSYTGGTDSHANIQPSLGCYYIMYIP